MKLSFKKASAFPTVVYVPNLSPCSMVKIVGNFTGKYSQSSVLNLRSPGDLFLIDPPRLLGAGAAS